MHQYHVCTVSINAITVNSICRDITASLDWYQLISKGPEPACFLLTFTQLHTDLPKGQYVISKLHQRHNSQSAFLGYW